MTRPAFSASAMLAIALVLSAACSSSNEASSGDSTATAGAGQAKLTVDGKDQTISGDIACVTTGDRLVISVGDQSKGVVGATLANDEIETLGIIVDGQPLAYTKGVPGSTATSSKDGASYKMSGELTGMPDMANPMAGPGRHSFTMDVSCPS